MKCSLTIILCYVKLLYTHSSTVELTQSVSQSVTVRVSIIHFSSCVIMFLNLYDCS